MHFVDEKPPWVTCLFSDILLGYLEEIGPGDRAIDYPALFSSIEGFEAPSDPERFLRDVNNWVPLGVLRDLLWQCERISGRKDFAYHAARAYFDPEKKKLPSLFEIIARVLDDVRSVVIFANSWAAVQTSHLKLQSFDKHGAAPQLYVLAQFEENAMPAIGSLHLLRGIFEGFPRLYPSIEEVQCLEEISQLRIEDIAREFPEYTIKTHENRLSIHDGDSVEPTIEAVTIPLRSETVTLAPEFRPNMFGDAVVQPADGQIKVLTREEETNPERRDRAPRAFKIIRPGILRHGALSHGLESDQIYNAPYSRFRFMWRESGRTPAELTAEEVRRQVIEFLFEHLDHIKQSHTRMMQFNIEKRRLALENLYLRREIGREYSFSGIVGQSPKIRELFGLIRSLSETDVTVLIQGETGTGKELIARAIHYSSPRRTRRFVAINCAALSETLLESELFGHEKGAFTGAITQRKGIFEAADGGTLFLDEIGETTASTQVKLLRVLQEGEFQRVGGTEPIKVDVRIIAATNQNLEELMKKGRFRQDLFYRLNVFPVDVPPLRERIEDIPLLVSHFVGRLKDNLNKKIGGVTPRAMAHLMAYSWPGNVRELENALQRMMVVAKGETLDVQELPPEIRGKGAELRREARDLKEIARIGRGDREENDPRRAVPNRKKHNPRGEAPRHQPRHPAKQDEALRSKGKDPRRALLRRLEPWKHRSFKGVRPSGRTSQAMV